MGLILLFGGAPAPPVEEVAPTAAIQGLRAILEIAYNDSTEVPIWEDESSRLRALSISRGRSAQFDHVQPGTATYVVDNRDGGLDPTNFDGPHYPNVRPMRLVRSFISIDVGATSFSMRRSTLRGGDVLRASPVVLPLHTGFTESLPQSWNVQDATVVIHAVDAFKVFNMDRFEDAEVDQELAGARITKVLDAIDWPADDRDLEDGQIVMAGQPAVPGLDVDQGALEYLQLVAVDSEDGILFMSRDGKVVFFDSAHTEPVDPDDIWGDISGEKRYRDIRDADFDDQQIWNSFRVLDYLGGAATAEDNPSILRYRRRVRAVSTVMFSGQQHTDRAWFLLARYREPILRVTELAPLVDLDDPDRIIDIFSRDLFDTLTVRKRPPAGGLIEQLSRIEGITITSPNKFDWRVTWRLSGVFQNLLSAEQSNVEDTADGWAAETNCSVASSATASLVGDAALRMTATGSGDMAARTTPDTQIPVNVGRRYRSTAYFHPGTTVRSVRLELNWRNSGGASVSSSAGVDTVENAPAGSWKAVVVEASAPAGATYVTLRAVVLAAGAAEVHDIDFIYLTPV